MYRALSLEEKKCVLESFLADRHSDRGTIPQVAYMPHHRIHFNHLASRLTAFSPTCFFPSYFRRLREAEQCRALTHFRMVSCTPDV